MSDTTAHPFRDRWLAAVRATPGLSSDDQRVAHWLANRLLDGGTMARGTWSQMRREVSLADHAAGVHLTTLVRVGLMGERIRTGPDQGFPLVIPVAGHSGPTYETRADLEAKNARRVAARRAADLVADAKWLAGK